MLASDLLRSLPCFLVNRPQAAATGYYDRRLLSRNFTIPESHRQRFFPSRAERPSVVTAFKLVVHRPARSETLRCSTSPGRNRASNPHSNRPCISECDAVQAGVTDTCKWGLSRSNRGSRWRCELTQTHSMRRFTNENRRHRNAAWKSYDSAALTN